MVYVDDIVITGNDNDAISWLKLFLPQHCHIKDLGNLKYFLGIEVARSRKGLFLSQRKYTLAILKDVGYLGGKPSDFPMDQNLQLTPTDGDLLLDPSAYQPLVSRLIYLTITRPDIVYSVNILSHFMHQPRKFHMDAAIHILHYLKSTPGRAILLSAYNDLRLYAYCDSDWASCPLHIVPL